MLNEGLENRAGVVKSLTFEKTENIHAFEILFSQPGLYPVERESSHSERDGEALLRTEVMLC